MSELTLFRAIHETRQLIRDGLGLMAAARMATNMLGGDPQYVALQAAEAEICCARCKADLLAAKLRRAGGDFSTPDGE